MLTWDYNLFIGDDTTDVHIGFAAGDSVFIIGEVTSSDEGESLKDSLDRLKSTIDSQKPRSLKEFASLMKTETESIAGSIVSLAAAYVVDDVLYVLTQGKGVVYVARSGNMQKLLDGDKTASGYIKENDYFMLANSVFTSKMPEDTLQKLLFNTKPQEVVETITPELKGTDNVGMIALFMQAQEQEDEEDETEEMDDARSQGATSAAGAGAAFGGGVGSAPSEGQQTRYAVEQPQETGYATDQGVGTVGQRGSRVAIGAKLKGFTSRFASAGSSRGKKLTLVLVVVLLAVLSWSVISGNARRQRSEFIEKAIEQQAVIDGKLAEAEDLVGANNQKALSLLDESKEILSNLEQEAEQKKLEDIAELASIAQAIESAEKSIKKEEEGQYEEYYDLNLIEKGAQAHALYTDGELLAMLDREAGNVYVLDIAEKSVETYSASDLKKATSVALHREEPYVFGADIGVLKFTSRTETESIIAADDEWGPVKDFWMYNGNIYLLDTGSDEIYKYLVAEEGYSEKRSYFGDGQSIDLGNAEAMAIDASIYIAEGARTEKYTSGVRQTFGINVPDDTEPVLSDVFASQDLDDAYFMDKESERIIITDKDGEFKKQIAASILSGADDFIVDPDQGILVLVGDTLYQIVE